MSTVLLPGEANVVRYASPMRVDDFGNVRANAFTRRKGEDGLSVQWLEALPGQSKSEQLAEARRLSRVELKRDGRFAELNVEIANQNLARENVTTSFVHCPLEATDQHEADESHSELRGLPPFEEQIQARIVGDFIAKHCITATHPAMVLTSSQTSREST